MFDFDGANIGLVFLVFQNSTCASAIVFIVLIVFLLQDSSLFFYVTKAAPNMWEPPVSDWVLKNPCGDYFITLTALVVPSV